MDCLVHETLQARILECVAFPFSRGSSQPRDRIEVSGLWEDYLPAEPQGKPKNTGVGSLSLFQQIFPTQELNQSLLHFKQILYQLSYQGSPEYDTSTEITGFVFSNCFRLKAYHLGEIHILVITFH